MSKFKKGDVVRCVSTDGAIGIKEGEFYVIETADSKTVTLVGFKNCWMASRFEFAHASPSIAVTVAEGKDPAAVAAEIERLAKPAGGTKHDGEKIRLELLPTRALEEIGKVLTFGAKKYDAWNWAKGFAWSRLIGATFRHLFAFARGEDRDPETGLSHLAHAGCCILFLLEHVLGGLGTDDRYKGKVS